jgi:hypothetical protein
LRRNVVHRTTSVIMRIGEKSYDFNQSSLLTWLVLVLLWQVGVGSGNDFYFSVTARDRFSFDSQRIILMCASSCASSPIEAKESNRKPAGFRS